MDYRQELTPSSKYKICLPMGVSIRAGGERKTEVFNEEPYEREGGARGPNVRAPKEIFIGQKKGGGGVNRTRRAVGGRGSVARGGAVVRWDCQIWSISQGE